jgi:hypothetical protein
LPRQVYFLLNTPTFTGHTTGHDRRDWIVSALAIGDVLDVLEA